MLLDKYLLGTATPEECALVEQWYQQQSDQRRLLETDDFEHLSKELWTGVRSRAGLSVPLPLSPKQNKYFRNRLFRYSAVAASLLITLSVSWYAYVYHYNPFGSDLKLVTLLGKDISAGKNAATLTLSDGSRILINDNFKGKLAVQPGVEIIKDKDGQLSYQVTDTELSEKEPVYNTIETPKGGQYQISLPDGSKIWLNSASSLKFTTALRTQKERKVTLKGEAYFEVAKDSSRPFKVSGDGQIVEVLGTHFNINGYSNEKNIRTTLLEGAVKINDLLLRPGQQSVLNKSGAIQVLSVHAEEAIAWKNGLFQFNETHLSSIMKQLERWYDISIKYEGDVPNIHYTGTISRNSSLSEVLQMLEDTGSARFTIREKTIIVSKK